MPRMLHSPRGAPRALTSPACSTAPRSARGAATCDKRLKGDQQGGGPPPPVLWLSPPSGTVAVTPSHAVAATPSGTPAVPRRPTAPRLSARRRSSRSRRPRPSRSSRSRSSSSSWTNGSKALSKEVRGRDSLLPVTSADQAVDANRSATQGANSAAGKLLAP